METKIQDYMAFDKEIIDIGTSPATFDADKAAEAKAIFLQIRTNSVSIWLDGSTPTADDGVLLEAGQDLTLRNPSDISNFKAVRAGTSDARGMVIYFR